MSAILSGIQLSTILNAKKNIKKGKVIYPKNNLTIY